MRNLLLIGSGQLGSRYIQGTIRNAINCNITVVDSSKLSLNNAKKIWTKSGGDKSFHKVFWTQTLPINIKQYDLAIVATSSKNRASLIDYICSKANVSYWVLEKVLAQSNKELKMIEVATSDAKNVYVNTPRRQMKWHQKIKSKIPDKIRLVKKTGKLWGLACNAIHFIDLVAWWTGQSLLSVDTKRLDKKWFKSKRNGYYEVTGELLAKFSGGTKLVLQSLHDAKEEILMVEFNKKDSCVIYENKGTALFSNGNILNGSLELQSEMTGPMIARILTKGTCELPTLKESLKQHEVFLEAMLEHWNISNNCKDKLVPIT